MADLARDAAELLVRAQRDPGDDRLLHRAITLFRRAREAGDGEPGAVAANLGLALRMLAERTGNPRLAAEAVDELTTAVAHAATSGRYLNLASARHVRFRLTDDGADLDAAIEAGRAAIETCTDDLARPVRLGSLAGLLLDRAERTGDGADAAEALALTRRAFTLPAPEDAFWSIVANNHLLALRLAYQRDGDPALADEAVTVGRETVRHLGPGSAGNLGLVLLARHRASGDPDDLREALDALAAAAARPGPERHLWRGNLVTALTDAYRADPTEPAFAELAAAGRAALDALDAADPRRGPMLVNLGGAHLQRFEHTGDPAALDAAERLHQEAVAATADVPVHRTLAFAGLAVAWQRRAAGTGDTDLLDRAIELGRSLLDRPLTRAEDRAGVLSTLGLALAERFVATGSEAAVAEAAEHLRDAVETLPAGHAQRLEHLANLTVLLLSWAEATGAQRVTDEALETARQAVSTTGGAGHLANLGGALWRRYVRTGDREALAEAVAAGRAAVDGTPAGHPDRPMYLSNLSGMLARLDGGLADAVACAREAVELTPPGHADRPMRLSNLGLVLRYRWEHDHDPPALDAAVAAAREAVATTPDGHPALPGRISNLAATLLAHGDRAEAARRFHDVARHELAPVALRIQTAARAGELAAEDAAWKTAAQEYALAVRLMPRLATHYTDRGDEEHDLARFAELPADAAACALHAGDARLAVEVLEVGTGVMLARTLQLRTDLTDLRERHPAAAARLEAVTQAIGGGGSPGSGVAASTLDGIRRRGADRAWREVVEEIRRLPGFADFQSPPTEADLRATAAEGPVVMVSSSRYRSDALVLGRNGAVTVVELPGLRHGDVIAAARVEVPGAELLAWLWDAVAAPVLDAVAASGRLWWMPIGVLALLPLHAAGRPGGPYVDDRVVPSYTPTLGSLRHHRSRPVPAQLRALVVGAPEGGTPLPAARAEAARLADLLVPRATLLPGADADAARVVPALREHGWVHFSGHARADLDQPSRSHLRLTDGPLTVADLAAAHVDGQVAVLAACSSTRTRPDLAAESVHIAAAFHLAGFGQVVGASWPVADRISLRFIQQVYRHVLDAGRPRPERLPAAVRYAVRRLRERWPDDPAAWAPYVHIGR
ncbi:CHAT domain-containing protein [Dactylosporangium sp. CS-047395]|uniref:CHAT domain-containing protein n=1 Tax=Dactylosporangium sp. CS-047395 TaxID=3239936 RepID=UPI003D8EEB1E